MDKFGMKFITDSDWFQSNLLE